MLLAAESSFATSLYDLCRNIVHEFVVLCRHCLEGGQAAFETMVQERLVSITVRRIISLFVIFVVFDVRVLHCCH